MRHLDFAAQGLRPDLNVRFTSVTEQWAQIAVVGPNARKLLEELAEEMGIETHPQQSSFLEKLKALFD